MKKIVLFALLGIVLASCQANMAQKETKSTAPVSQLSDNQLMDKVQSDALKYFGTMQNLTLYWEESATTKTIFIQTMISM